MEKNVIRLLKAEEIECRASTVNEKGVALLLYKDARVDQRILDETFGPLGWKRSHQCIDGSLYCTVEVYDSEKGEWVSKQDVGTMGFAEKEKSQASDSFKRACFNWGIGRELYSAPFIWIPASKTSVQKKGEKFFCNARFSVRSISYNSEREIDGLVIADEKGKEVYELKTGSAAAGNGEKSRISDKEMELLETELKRTGVGMGEVMERYHIHESGDMTGELYGRIMKALAKTKSAA